MANDQLMTLDLNDGPTSSDNQPGCFGIEIEVITNVSVRNIWVKKLD
jgi:hypothetical protein